MKRTQPMPLIITSELSKNFFQEEDAIKGFKTAVDNNQLRLAMQILTEIIDAFAEGFEVIFDAPEEEVTTEEVKTEPEQQKPAEKKAASKKTEQKEETPKESE